MRFLAVCAGVLASTSIAFAQLASFADTRDMLRRVVIPPTGTLSYSGHGTAMKGSVIPLPQPAVRENPGLSFLPWPTIGGFATYMTWRRGDSGYFNGQRLFADFAVWVYGLPADTPLTTNTNPHDASSPTLAQFYSTAYNHLNPGADSIVFPQTLPDNQTTSYSLVDVLNKMPSMMRHPFDPTHVITPAEFSKLMAVYWNFITAHTNTYFTTMLLPFLIMKVPYLVENNINNGYLLNLDEMISNGPDVLMGATPILKLPSWVSYRSDRGWFFPGPPKGPARDPEHFYDFKVLYRYWVQQFPSVVNTTFPLPPKEISFRAPGSSGDLDNPMSILAGSFFLQAPPAVQKEANGDNTINSAFFTAGKDPKLPAFMDHLLDPVTLDLATPDTPISPAPVRIDTEAKVTIYDPPSHSYFSMVQTPAGSTPFTLTDADVTQINTVAMGDLSRVDSARLVGCFTPTPSVLFQPAHLAASNSPASAPSNDSELALRMQTNGVSVNAVRRAAMQMLVSSQISMTQSPVTSGASITYPTTSFVDDTYVFTNYYAASAPRSLRELNEQLLTTVVRGGQAAPGDPYRRNPVDATRIVRNTPASTDMSRSTTIPATLTDRHIAYFPDPGQAADMAFLNQGRGYSHLPFPGDPVSWGNGFLQAVIGRGAYFNYVYDKDGATLDQRPWRNPRHVAAVWPYQVPADASFKAPPGSPAGSPVLGPYILNLDAVAANPKAQLLYRYAQKPFFYPNDALPAGKPDPCTPVVLKGALLDAVNALYESDSVNDLHMTVQTAGTWGVSNHGYMYSANLSLADAENNPPPPQMSSLILKVAFVNGTTGEPIPMPPGAVPLSVGFPTYEGWVPPQLLPAGSAPVESVASFDARIYTDPTHKGNQTGQDTPSISRYSLDQTVQVGAVNGCGQQFILQSQTIACASQVKPMCSLSVLPTDGEKKPFTLGVPNNPKNLLRDFTAGTGTVPQFTKHDPDNISSLVNSSNAQRVAASFTTDVLDGTRAAGTEANPGNEFFRPVDPEHKVLSSIVKGRRVILGILASSVIPFGFDLYDADNPELSSQRPAFFQTPYAGFIRRMDVAIYPPDRLGGCKKAPEHRSTPYAFTAREFGSVTFPPPPDLNMSYVFREATTPQPPLDQDLGPQDRYYVVVVVVTDHAGQVRTTRFPIFVEEEELKTQRLRSEDERR